MTEKKEAKVKETNRGPEWVRDMHAHYANTGSYRAEDVQRVLGDPRKCIGMPASQELFAAASTRKVKV